MEDGGAVRTLGFALSKYLPRRPQQGESIEEQVDGGRMHLLRSD